MSETAYFRGEGGVIWEMTLPLPAAQMDKLRKGYLVRVNRDGTPWAGDGPTPPAAAPAAGDAGADAPQPRLPDTRAPKADWVGWVVRHCGLAPDDAEALTKQDLIDRARAWLAGGGG